MSTTRRTLFLLPVLALALLTAPVANAQQESEVKLYDAFTVVGLVEGALFTSFDARYVKGTKDLPAARYYLRKRSGRSVQLIAATRPTGDLIDADEVVAVFKKAGVNISKATSELTAYEVSGRYTVGEALREGKSVKDVQKILLRKLPQPRRARYKLHSLLKPRLSADTVSSFLNGYGMRMVGISDVTYDKENNLLVIKSRSGKQLNLPARGGIVSAKHLTQALNRLGVNDLHPRLLTTLYTRHEELLRYPAVVFPGN